jgi:hypothetical protein
MHRASARLSLFLALFECIALSACGFSIGQRSPIITFGHSLDEHVQLVAEESTYIRSEVNALRILAMSLPNPLSASLFQHAADGNLDLGVPESNNSGSFGLMRIISFRVRSILVVIVTCATILYAQVLPKPQAPFGGKIGRTVKDSIPDFPKGVEAPKGAMNILLILAEDVDVSASSTFGGPIQTPTLQQLAHEGLRYNTFHTTALCSLTRAALITGRNHHSCASGRHHGICHRLSWL